MRLPATTHGVVLLSIAFLAACSSSSNPPAGGTGPTPTTTGVDPGTPPPTPPGTPTPPPGSSPPPPPVKGTSFEACTISDSPEAKFFGGFTVAGGAVYASLDYAVRRYTVSTSGACTLTRDMSFGTSGVLSGTVIHGDAAGGLWTPGGLGGVSRIAGGTAMTCTADASLSSKTLSWFAIDPSASGGYAFYASASSLAMGRITIGASACSIAPITLSDAVSSQSRGGAVDDLGRLHVATTSAGDTPEVQVFDSGGKLVTTYTQIDASTPIGRIADVTRCGAGICLLGLDDANVATFDDGGKGRAIVDAPGLPPFGMSAGDLAELVAGEPTGPMFVAWIDRALTANTAKLVVQRAAVP